MMTDRTFAEYGINIQGGRGNIKTYCPECSHTRKKKKDKCLSVNCVKGVWNCHHCGWTGSLNKKDGVYEVQPVSKVYKKPKVQLNNMLNEKVLKYFSDRGISKEILEKAKIRL